MTNTKQKVKLSELPITKAVAVKAEGLVDVSVGEQVLVGVKCIWDGTRFVPTTKNFKEVSNIFDYCDPGEVVVIKRIANL